MGKAAFTHFEGAHFQRGQGIFSDFIRTYAIPALTRAAPHVLKGVKKIAKDLSKGQSLKRSIKKRGISTLKRVAKSVIGGGRVVKRRKRQRKPKRKQAKTRKRRVVKRRIKGVVKRRFKKNKFPLLA